MLYDSAVIREALMNGAIEIIFDIGWKMSKQAKVNPTEESDSKLTQRLAFCRLFDVYGKLLTEKQEDCLTRYLYDDWSLSEIGECLGISRQAVYDMLRRTRDTLDGYEARLKIIAKRDDEKKKLQAIHTSFAASLTKGEREKSLKALQNFIEHYDDILGDFPTEDNERRKKEGKK